MPLVYQHNINEDTKLALWHITETENFFEEKVPIGREITHWHKRLQHLAGRYLLQVLNPEFPYHLIEIADTRKPYLPGEEYHFSISHCGDYAAVITSNTQRVGIDIELSTPRIIRLKNKFLNAEELSIHPHYESYLTLLWAVKEAMFKWYGKGEVDFRTHMHVQQVIGSINGEVNAIFRKEMNAELKLAFRKMNGMSMAWLAT